MKICVVGAGVIGTIYGSVLAAAGNDVTHYVRPGTSATLRAGVDINLFDARGEAPTESTTRYAPPVVEQLDANDPFELILASVRHDQLPTLLPVLVNGAGDAEILLFGNLWSSFDPIDAVLPGRYPWGFPVAGGGFDDGRLEAALLATVRLGDPSGVAAHRLESIGRVFDPCGLSVHSTKTRRPRSRTAPTLSSSRQWRATSDPTTPTPCCAGDCSNAASGSTVSEHCLSTSRS